MSCVSKRIRPFLQVFDDLGVEVVDLTSTGSCHYKIEVTCGSNRRFFIAPFSSGDHRAIKNFTADVKRWKRSLANT